MGVGICCCGSSGACTGNVMPTNPVWTFGSIPGGSKNGSSLTFTQGAPACGSVVGYYRSGFVATATLSSSAWYTPYDPSISSQVLPYGVNPDGGLLMMWFSGCGGVVTTVLRQTNGTTGVVSWVIDSYDRDWTFALTNGPVFSAAEGMTLPGNTNSPFAVNNITSNRQSPALIYGPVMSGGTGTTVFPTVTVGAPVYT